MLVERARFRLDACSEGSASVQERLSEVLVKEHESAFSEVSGVLNDIDRAGGLD